MVNDQGVRVKLTNRQLSKLKSAAINKKGTLLKSNKNKSEYEKLPHELFLTTRQTIRICNVNVNNMSTDIKLSKDQISIFFKEV